MSTERDRCALELLEQVLALPADHRATWIADTCGDDIALADEVRSLLAAHGDADEFLESGLLHITPTAVFGQLDNSHLEPGRQLGDFVVEQQIGAGGMGLVYRAKQISLNRLVALKVLPPYLRYSDSARTRFRREIEAAGRLQHRNIVSVYTTGEDLGLTYYAMQLVEGPSLSELIARLLVNPIPELRSIALDGTTANRMAESTLNVAGAVKPRPDSLQATIDRSLLESDNGYFRTVARLMADVADGLDYAHSRGVVHRDVKPSNLLFSADGQVLLSDFGLALIAEEPGMTRTGEVLGTPFYMAPEQVTPGLHEVDGRTDIYSLGATLYELLTLRPPFVGESRDQVTSQIATVEVALPRTINRHVPIDLETISRKALEKNPGHRYHTAQQMAYDLREFAAGRSIGTRPVGLLARGLRWVQRKQAAATVAASMVLLIAAVLFFAYRMHLAEARWTDAQFDHVFSEAQFAAMEGDLKGASELIDKAEQLGATDTQLNLLRGQLALQTGMFQRACDLLEEAVQQAPNNVAARALLSLAYDSNEQDDDTIDVLARLGQLEPVSLQDYLLLGQARLFNDFDSGLDLLNEAVQRDKTNIVARLVRGGALVHKAGVSGDPQHAELALDDLRIASELLEPNAFLLGRSMQAQLIAASCYKLNGNMPDFQRSLELASNTAEALAALHDNYRSHRWLAMYYDYIGDDDRALASWQAMKDVRIAYYVIALFRLGHFDEAIELCDERLDRYPGGRFTQFFRALMLTALEDDPQLVLDEFVMPLDEETLDLKNTHRFHYIVYCLAGELEEARRRSSLLRDLGKNFDAHDPWRVHLHAYTCGEVSDNTLFEAAAESQLTLIEGHFIVGVTKLAEGHRAAARQHFVAATAFNPLGLLEGPMSRAFLAQLDRDPRWPLWVETPGTTGVSAPVD